jgi:arginine repressor
MYGEYTRNRILTLAQANKTPTEIVSILGEENIVVVRSTVSRIIQRTREKEQGRQRQDYNKRVRSILFLQYDQK